MNQQSDLHYFTRRNREEAERAKRCFEPSARRAHQQLSELHRMRARDALMAMVRNTAAPDDDAQSA